MKRQPQDVGVPTLNPEAPPFYDQPEDLNESSKGTWILACALHFHLKWRYPSGLSGFLAGKKSDETRLRKSITHSRVDAWIKILVHRLCTQPFI
jgi:hypothetical protein